MKITSLINILKWPFGAAQRQMERGQARDDALREEWRKRDEAFRAAYVPPAEANPQTQRILEFARLPDMAKQREVAVKAYADRLDSLLKPAGFTCRKTIWTRALGQGQAKVNLHRDRNGFICTVRLTYSGPRRAIRAEGPGEAWLGSFYGCGVESETDGGSVGWIDYSLILKDPSRLDLPLTILQDRALPWLLTHEDGHWPQLRNAGKHW
jgi:hypothetical protein